MGRRPSLSIKQKILRDGRVCAGNPRRVSRAIEILSFQNFYNVLKTCSAGRKNFFDTLRAITLYVMALRRFYMSFLIRVMLLSI